MVYIITYIVLYKHYQMNSRSKIRTATLAILCFALFACHTPADISGTINGLGKEARKIFLIEPTSLRSVAASYYGKVVDSAVIQPNGSFEFRILTQKQTTVLYELAISQESKAPNYLQTDEPNHANFMPILWKKGEKLQITANAQEFQKSFSIANPSEENTAMLSLRNVNQKAYADYLLGKTWEVHEGIQLLEKEHAVLQYQSELIAFADTSTYFSPALVALRWVSPTGDYERVPEFLVRLYNKWEDKQPNHPWVKELSELSNLKKLPLLIGDTFPDIDFFGLSKDTLSLHELLGKKLTIVDVWASWCAPCRIENRKVFGPLWDTYNNSGLQIIAYALEADESSWKSAAKADGADRWFQSSELQGDDAPFMQKIRISTIPANFILDNNGKIIAKNIHGQALVDFVEEYFWGENTLN